MKKRIYLKAICLILTLACLFSFSACDNSRRRDGEENKVDFSELDDSEKLTAAQSYFTTEVLRAVAEDNLKENICLSPLSIMTALAMAVNGADGETLAEMESVLGLSAEELNSILGSYVKSLSGDTLKLANSAWIKDDLDINSDYTDICADVYDAEIYKATFTNETVDEINGWVKDRTDGKIEEIISELDKDTVMFLINALSFDADWAVPYTSAPIKDAFYPLGGNVSSAEYMRSVEYKYIENENAVGFIKDYKGNYSLVALLPDKDMTVYDYLDSIGSQGLMGEIENVKEQKVYATIPMFDYDFDVEMSDVFKKMGMESAFDYKKADFFKMTNDDSQLYINKIIHKTDITVDTDGTEAAASTAVEFALYSASIHIDGASVTLDRPFVYMIIDNISMIPLFVGVVTQP